MIAMIASLGKNNEIGKNNDLIWTLKADMKEFKKRTDGNIMVMGRNTFNSLPSILPNRKYIVLSTTKKFNKTLNADITSVDNVLALIKKCRELSQKKDVYIIGGASLYHLFMDYADKMYLTHIDATDDEADTFFPEINKDEWDITLLSMGEEKKIPYSIVEYIKK